MIQIGTLSDLALLRRKIEAERTDSNRKRQRQQPRSNRATIGLHDEFAEVQRRKERQ